MKYYRLIPEKEVAQLRFPQAYSTELDLSPIYSIFEKQLYRDKTEFSSISEILDCDRNIIGLSATIEPIVKFDGNSRD